MALAVVAVVAIIIGVSMGFVTKPPPPPSLFLPHPSAPNSAPTSQIEALLRPTLPLYMLDNLRDTSSPQYHAHESVTDVDKRPEMDAPGDDQLPFRLERIMQRFDLATLHHATGGENRWTNNTEWLNSTAHECQWFRCCCGSDCSETSRP
jgi:hypothetical protein